MNSFIELITPLTAFFIMVAAIANMSKSLITRNIEKLKLDEAKKEKEITNAAKNAKNELKKSETTKPKVMWFPLIVCLLFMLIQVVRIVDFLHSSEPITRGAVISAGLMCAFFIFFMNAAGFFLLYPMIRRLFELKTELIFHQSLSKVLTSLWEQIKKQNQPG